MSPVSGVLLLPVSKDEQRESNLMIQKQQPVEGGQQAFFRPLPIGGNHSDDCHDWNGENGRHGDQPTNTIGPPGIHIVTPGNCCGEPELYNLRKEHIL